MFRKPFLPENLLLELSRCLSVTERPQIFFVPRRETAASRRELSAAYSQPLPARISMRLQPLAAHEFTGSKLRIFLGKKNPPA
jgi:hypothetical protein